VFLLVCVSLIPTFLHRIPLCALAAMLVYTGYRLAHPKEFVNVYRIGPEQLLIFVVTIIAVLATDLLIGILIGIVLKMVLHLANGVSLRSIFKPYLEVAQLDDKHCVIRAHQSAIFSNWIPFRRQIENLGLVQRQNVTVDLANTHLVDSSTMEKLHEMQGVFEAEDLSLHIVGLDSHQAVAKHEMARRIGGLVRMRRLTVLADLPIVTLIESICAEYGVASYSVQACRGRIDLEGPVNRERDAGALQECGRVEVVASYTVCEQLVAAIRTQSRPSDRLTVYTEAIDMMRRPTA